MFITINIDFIYRENKKIVNRNILTETFWGFEELVKKYQN